MHGLLFTDEIEDIKKIWSYGWVFIGEYVNEKTINHIVKYVTKLDIKNKGYKPKILSSPGIGANYTKRTDSNINKYIKNNTKEYYRTTKGLKLALPIYYRNKIYTEDQREKLWLEKLDKQERYILGEKISIKNGEQEYFKQLKFAQQKNKRLGYGDNTSEWDIEHYKEYKKHLKK